MGTLGDRQEFIDDQGEVWTFHTLLSEGGVTFMATAPGLGERVLTPRSQPTSNHRPRRDAEEPLPLENP